VRDAAEREPGERRPQHAGRARGGDSGALERDACKRRRGQPGRRNAPRKAGGARGHAQRPERHQQSVGRIAGAQHVLDVEQLGRDRHREEQQRADGSSERDPQNGVRGQEGDAVARRAAVTGRLGQRHGPQQARVLDAVGQPPRDAAQHDGRPEQREEERGERQRRAGPRLDMQRERDPEEEVAERGEPDGTDDQPDIAKTEHGHGGQLAPPPWMQRAHSVNAA